MTPPLDKSGLRARMRAFLSTIPDEDLAAHSQAACASLLEILGQRDARAIMLWMPVPHEVDLLPLGESLLRQGRRVCMPRMDWEQHTMEPVPVTNLREGFEIRHHDIPEPTESLSLPLDALDAVLVPGLAFDAGGYRLGRGGGFYDRFLTRLKPNTATIGVCFSVQRVDAVPVVSHDMPLDMVVCEDHVAHH